MKVPAVLADPNQLELALLNLVVNARDAMPRGGNVVIAAKEAILEDPILRGRFVCFSVADSGEGMDPETLARATEPFFTTKGIGKGTGLGLPMVHSVAEQAGGCFILRSEKGHGTTAEMWLPLASSAAARDVRATPQAAQRKAAPRVILLVDDDTLVLSSAAAMLEDLGHRIVAATSGKDALELLAVHTEVEIVFADHAMPEMTGAQLAVEIRKKRPVLPIVLATGFAELPSELAPDIARLSKPFTQHDLEVVLANIFPLRDATSQA